MPIEAATYINTLDATFPTSAEGVKDGDDHLRLIKSAIKATFPAVTGPVTGGQTELNRATTAFVAAGTVTIANGGTVGALIDLNGGSTGKRVRIRNTSASGDGALSLDIENAGGSIVAGRATLDVSGHLTTAGDLRAGGVVKQGGNTLLPTGAIILWYGTTSNIPAGWVLCDGTNGTPDLRGKFVKAAGGATTPLTTGGASGYTFTTSAVANHTHTGASGVAGAHSHSAGITAAGGHNHGGVTYDTAITIAQMPQHSHVQQVYNSGGVGGPTASPAGTGGSGVIDANISTKDTGSGQGHNHGVPPEADHTHGVTVASAADHSHTITGDGAHSHTVSATGVEPPYLALCYIMKL